MIVWITGRPASGKTTIGKRVVASLGKDAVLLDSDEVRAAITPQPSYSRDERMLVYAAIAYAARRLSDAGKTAIVAATAHDAELRQRIREICGTMKWVYTKCPLEVCEARDPKGLYRRARATASGSMPGVHVPFADPDADLVIDTSHLEEDVLERAARSVVGLLQRATDP
jgi:adenylylsulfate kinase